MTVTMALTPEQERQLRRAARVRGVDADALLRRLVDGMIAQLEPETAVRPTRVLGLHAGQTWVSDDFDAPLPESFWFGTE